MIGKRKRKNILPSRILSLFVLFTLIGISFLPTKISFAQSETLDLQMKAKAIFDGNFKYGEWLLIWVELDNEGPNIKAEIRARVPSSAGMLVFSTPADLPTTSRKRIPLYVLPNNFSQEIEVQLVEGDQLLAKSKVALRPNPPINYMVGILAPERGTLALLNAVVLPGITRPIILVDLSLEDFPERYEGFRSLDTLIINNMDTSRLTPEQVLALETWVRNGGRLVIGGGANAQLTLAGLPPSLIPFSYEGNIELQKLTSLEDFIDNRPAKRPIQVPGPFIVSTGIAKNQQLLIAQDNVSILMEWKIGTGYVDFSSLDLNSSPFDAWNGTIAFWEKLLSPNAIYPTWLPSDMSTRQQLASQMPYVLSNLPMLDLPSTQGLAILLAIYILVIGPINYLILRRMNRLHWAWVTIPVITIIFSLGAFSLGYLLHGTEIFVNKIAIIELDASGRANIHSYIGLFSPKRVTYDVEVYGDKLISPLAQYYDPWSNPSAQSGFIANEIFLEQTNPGKLRGLNIDQWSMQSFVTEGLETEGWNIIADLSIRDNWLTGTIRNESTKALQDAAVILGNSFSRLGDLPSGGTVEFGLDLSSINQPFFGPSISYQLFTNELNAVGPLGPNRQAEVKRSLIEGIFERFLPVKPLSSVSGFYSSQAQTPMLIGWLSEAPPDVAVRGHASAQQTTALVYMPLTYTLPKDGSIAIPPGLIPGWLIETPLDGGTCGPPGTTAVYTSRGEGVFEFQIVKEFLDIQIHHLKLSLFTDSAWDNPPDISIYNWQRATWVNLQGIIQGINLIPQPINLISPQGKVQVRLSAKNSMGGCYYIGLGLDGSR